MPNPRSVAVFLCLTMLCGCQTETARPDKTADKVEQKKPQATKRVKVERLEDGSEQVRIYYADTTGKKSEKVVSAEKSAAFLKKMREARALGSYPMQEAAMDEFLNQVDKPEK